METVQRLQLAGYQVDAVSIGGVETCFQVPAFGVCLDIGRCPPGAERQPTLLLTHAHIDHAAGLPYYVSMRGLIKAPAPRVFCPEPARAALQQILETWATLDSDADRCTLQGVAAGDEIPLGKSTFARAFKSPHRVATIGYTLMRRTKKLKAELVGSPTERIAELARGGMEVSEPTETAEICFPGDTMADVIDREPSVTRARVLLLECTFVGDEISPEQARRRGHVHLDQLAEHADRFENEVIVLTHFSKRHRPEEIREQVDRKLPSKLRQRVQLLLHG